MECVVQGILEAKVGVVRGGFFFSLSLSLLNLFCDTCDGCGVDALHAVPISSYFVRGCGPSLPLCRCLPVSGICQELH